MTRPDGVEQARIQLSDQGAGGFVWNHNIPKNSMRGRWSFSVHSDPKRAALAATKVLVADFEPEKIDFTINASAETLDPENPAPISVDARYLFGAVGSGLTVNGEAIVKSERVLRKLPGYVFGLAGEKLTAITATFRSNCHRKRW